MSFRLKIISLILFVSLVPYIFTMLYSANTLRDEYYANAKDNLQTQLSLSIGKIDQYINNLHRDMVFMSHMDVMNDIYSHDIDRRISILLENKKKDLSLDGDFYLVDKNNKIIASSNKNISPMSELKIKYTPLYTVPIKSNFDGKEIAKLIVDFSLKNISHFFDNGDDKFYYITVNNKILFKTKSFINKIEVKQVLDTKKDIHIVLEKNQKAFIESLKRYEILFSLVLFIGAILITLIASFLLNKLIKPILDLSQLVHTITKTKDYSRAVFVKGSDEIAKLAKAFNTMLHGIDKALHENELLNKEIEETQREVVFTMGAIGESRSKETGNHVKRVAEYSKLLALFYGLSEEESEMIKQASPMHDIGKVAIPDAVLNKPGRFNEEERAIMDTHAQLGYEMLKHSQRPLLKAAAIVAYEHHEKYDGSGYPRGLAAEEIHIYGRITALADVFDALGSDRVYKKAWDDERIFSLFKEERGKHFDPLLIDIFFENINQFLAIRDKFQDVE